MTILTLYQIDPQLAAKIRELLEAAMMSSKPPRKEKLRKMLRELDEAYECWDDDKNEEAETQPVAETKIVEPFDPFDL